MDDELRLNPTDEIVLDFLAEGRCTPMYISQRTDYTRQNIQNRLVRFVEHGYVEKIAPGLYELVSDPRCQS